MSRVWAAVAALWVGGTWTPHSIAQNAGQQATVPRPAGRTPAGSTAATNGVDVELHAASEVVAGDALLLRGVAYEVRGLAQLVAVGGVEIHATIGTSVGAHASHIDSDQRGTSGPDGGFLLRLAVPSAARGLRQLEVTASRAAVHRVFRYDVSVLPSERLELRTDRALYEPGETIHAWCRVLDVRSRAPVSSRRVEITIERDDASLRLDRRTQTTAASGVAETSVRVPAHIAEGSFRVTARVLDPGGGVSAARDVRVGTRTRDQMLVDVEIETHDVAPGSHVRGRVRVTTPAGNAAGDAVVRIRPYHSGSFTAFRTDTHGVAAFDLAAPAFLRGPSTHETLDVRVSHAGYGFFSTSRTYVVTRSPFDVALTPASGAIVPEVAHPVYAAVTRPDGTPAPGVSVTITHRTATVRPVAAVTDAHGLAVFDVTLPRHSAARHPYGGDCNPDTATTFDLRLGATAARTNSICVRVAADAAVLPRARAPVALPGGRIDVDLFRRPSASGLPVVVELLVASANDTGVRVLDARTVEGRANSASFDLPAGVLGNVRVRARAATHSAFSEGVGSSDGVLVRPRTVFAATLDAQPPTHAVRETAHVRVHAPAGTTNAFAAVVVRDLSAHAGEPDFASRWLEPAFDDALLEPTAEVSARMLRYAIAATLTPDGAPRVAPPRRDLGDPGSGDESDDENQDNDDVEPVTEEGARERGDLRDPFALRDEFLRRSLVDVVHAIEHAVDESITGEIDGTLVDRAGTRDFDPDLIAHLVERGELEPAQVEGVGGVPVTIAALREPTFGLTFERVARRVARRRLVRLLEWLAAFADPGADTRSAVAADPPERWLSRMIQRGVIHAEDLRDPWGGTFVLRLAAGRSPAIAIAARAAGWELVSPGPDRRAGTGDDVRDPLARVVPETTLFAALSGENVLLRQLARLDTGANILRNVLAAFDRVGSQALEDQIGDVAVSGEGMGGGGTGEGTIGLGNIGAIGHGSGTGSGGGGMGYGRGAARGPMLRSSALAALVRERFPATLFFEGQRALDASGTTTFDVQLADALTTYRVEAIVWTTEGWTTTARTELRVTQDIVADAPIPEIVHVGDSLRVPVRVYNRGAQSVQARVTVAASDASVRVSNGSFEITIAPGDAVERLVTIDALRPARAAITVSAVDARTGASLDSVRRSIESRVPGRLGTITVERVVDAHGVLDVEVPANAIDRRVGVVRVHPSRALFGDPLAWGPGEDELAWAAWVLAFRGQTVPSRQGAAAGANGIHPNRQDLASLALLARDTAVQWWADLEHNAVQTHLAALRTTIDGVERARPAPGSRTDGPSRASIVANALLALAPALRGISRHPELAADLRDVVSRMRRFVESETASAEGDPESFAVASAALAWTAPVRSPRANEFERRAQPAIVRSGDGVFVDVPGSDPANRASASAAMALASLAGGPRDVGLAIVRTFAATDRSRSIENPETRARFAVAADRLASSDDRVPNLPSIRVDNVALTLEPLSATPFADAPALSVPGHHRVTVEIAGGGLLVVDAATTFALPWSSGGAPRGALEIALTGDTGVRDDRSNWTVTVRNTAPRTWSSPQLEITLPSGAALEPWARDDMRRRARGSVSVEDGVVHVGLGAMTPGTVFRIPLRVRWTLGGSVLGPGFVARTSGQPAAAISVLAPTRVDVPDAASGPARAVQR